MINTSTQIEYLKKIYPIQTGINNPILRSENNKIEKFDLELEEFCDALVQLMYEYDWVWLASPQIWKNIRAIACSFFRWWDETWDHIWDFVFINPVIIEKSDQMTRSEEACLSIPGETGFVMRHKKVTVEYYDTKWNKKKKKLNWFNAIVAQHEIDHLDWILFVDKLIEQKNLIPTS